MNLPRSTALTLLAAVVLSPLAEGQSPTSHSPRRAASGHSDSSNRYPFGEPALEYQQVHSGWSFSNRALRTIIGVRFTPSNTGQAARVELEMWMARSPHAADGTSPVFAANEVAGTRVRVVDRRFVTLPATTSGWDLHIPFDRPFTWDGGHLSWRVRMHGNDQGNSTLAYSLAADGSSSRSTQIGSFGGCASPQGDRAAQHYGQFHPAGITSSVYANSRVANTVLPGVMTFGLSSTVLNGVALPLDLTPLGAGGCQITNDVQAAVPFTTVSDTYGSARVDLVLPDQPGLIGQQVFTQAVFVEPAANALGVFLSPGAAHVLPGRNGVARIFGGQGQTSGSVGSLFGLVLGLEGN